MKNENRFVSLLWLIVFVVFSYVARYLIKSNLSTNTKSFLIAIGWLFLGWSCFWIDYKYRLTKKNKKSK